MVCGVVIRSLIGLMTLELMKKKFLFFEIFVYFVVVFFYCYRVVVVLINTEQSEFILNEP